MPDLPFLFVGYKGRPFFFSGMCAGGVCWVHRLPVSGYSRVLLVNTPDEEGGAAGRRVQPVGLRICPRLLDILCPHSGLSNEHRQRRRLAALKCGWIVCGESIRRISF